MTPRLGCRDSSFPGRPTRNPRIAQSQIAIVSPHRRLTEDAHSVQHRFVLKLVPSERGSRCSFAGESGIGLQISQVNSSTQRVLCGLRTSVPESTYLYTSDCPLLPTISTIPISPSAFELSFSNHVLTPAQSTASPHSSRNTL